MIYQNIKYELIFFTTDSSFDSSFISSMQFVMVKFTVGLHRL